MTKGIEMYKERTEKKTVDLLVWKEGGTCKMLDWYNEARTYNEGLEAIKDMGCARASTQSGMPLQLFVMH